MLTRRKLAIAGLVIVAFVAGALLTQVLFFGGDDAPPSDQSTGNQLSCDNQQFLDIWRSDTSRGDANVEKALCREGYAYVMFTGPSAGVHGTQDALMRATNGKYVDIAWGSTSQGTLKASDLPPDVDAHQIARVFPEASLLFDGG